MKYIILLLTFLISSTSIAGTRDPNKTDEQYIQYGSNFNYVCRIKCTTTNGIVYFASATIIDSHWILTAAHVVIKAEKAEIINQDKIIKISKIIPHKDFVEANYGFYDIALCYIDEPINLDFYPELYTDSDELNKTCSISGYGSYGTFKTGITNTDGQRRAGKNRVEFIDRHMLVCDASMPDSPKSTDLEFIIANGDSGGGLFIANKIAGVNSCVMAIDRKTDSNYGDEGGHTRVSKFVDWINENKR